MVCTLHLIVLTFADLAEVADDQESAACTLGHLYDFGGRSRGRVVIARESQLDAVDHAQDGVGEFDAGDDDRSESHVKAEKTAKHW